MLIESVWYFSLAPLDRCHSHIPYNILSAGGRDGKTIQDPIRFKS